MKTPDKRKGRPPRQENGPHHIDQASSNSSASGAAEHAALVASVAVVAQHVRVDDPLVGRAADIAIERGRPTVALGVTMFGVPVICTSEHVDCFNRGGSIGLVPDIAAVEAAANNRPAPSWAPRWRRRDGRSAAIVPGPLADAR